MSVQNLLKFSLLLAFGHALSPKGSLAEVEISNKLKIEAKIKELYQNKEVQRAEQAFQQSRHNTDELLKKIHKDLSTVTTDLTKTSQDEVHDLALLQESRVKENKILDDTVRRLDQFAKQPIKPLPISFLETKSADYEKMFAPLKQAAQNAKSFAAEIKKQAAEFQEMRHMNPTSFAAALRKLTGAGDSSSFLETGANAALNAKITDNSKKAEASLLLARQAIANLNQDLAIQRKHLVEEESKLNEDEQRLGLPTTTVTDSVPFASAVSFVQTVQKTSNPMNRLQAAFDESKKSLETLESKLGEANTAYDSFATDLSSIFTDTGSVKNSVANILSSIDSKLAGYDIPVVPASRTSVVVNKDNDKGSSFFQQKFDKLLERLHKKVSIGDFEATVAEFTSQIKSIEDDYYTLYDQNRANVQTMHNMKTGFLAIKTALENKVEPTINKIIETSTAKKSSATTSTVEVGVEGAGDDTPVKPHRVVRRDPPVKA